MLPSFPVVPPIGWAAPYIGRPWVWQGRGPDAFDCAGWLHFAWTHYWSLTLPDWQTAQTAGDALQRTRQSRDLIAMFLTHYTKLEHPVPGCGVLMRQGQLANHVGLYERGADIIHACETAGSVVRERRADIQGRILGFYVPSSLLTERAA